jgi:membrane fusion protein, multidrug efflux system
MNLKTTLSGFLAVAFLSFAPPAQAQSASNEPPIEVKIVRPHRGEIYRYINLPGEVHPYLRVTLFTKVDGYLTNLTVDKGDSVKTGDLIADIDVPELRANLVRYKAEAELAAAEFDQINDAPTNHPPATALADIRAARNRIALAKGHLATVRANVEYTEIMINYARVTAPFDGIITKRYVDPGAYIPVPNAADTPEAAAIVDVTDLQTLRMQVAVPENEVRHIMLNQPIRWTTDALPGEIFDGTVTRAYWALDRATKTMLTEVQLTNRNMMLRPGMLVNAKIGLEKKDDTMLLPAPTLVKEKLNSFVFLVVDGRAKKTPVKTGFNDGANFEIVNGLKGEDLAILVGQQVLRDGQPIKLVEGR